MTALPVLDCGGCPGLCCRHLGRPPFVYPVDPVEDCPPGYLDESPDKERVMGLPAEALAAIRSHQAAHYDPDGLPCCWLDAAGRCAHYAHRPEACREAVVPGDEWCLGFRAEAGR